MFTSLTRAVQSYLNGFVDTLILPFCLHLAKIECQGMKNVTLVTRWNLRLKPHEVKLKPSQFRLNQMLENSKTWKNSKFYFGGRNLWWSSLISYHVFNHLDSYHYQKSQMVEPWQQFLLFLLVITIQDGQKQAQIEDRRFVVFWDWLLFKMANNMATDKRCQQKVSAIQTGIWSFFKVSGVHFNLT